MSSFKQVKSQKSFNGFTNVYEHDSTSTGTKMTMSVYLPPSVSDDGLSLPSDSKPAALADVGWAVWHLFPGG